MGLLAVMFGGAWSPGLKFTSLVHKRDNVAVQQYASLLQITFAMSETQQSSTCDNCAGISGCMQVPRVDY
jgi:hypothetical protein